MKKFSIGLLIFFAALGAFAQSDLQPLAVVKLNKSETITVKQLKTRANFIQKQYGMESLPIEQKQALLENLIAEKLITQAAAKEGLSVTDSQVDDAFLNTFSQQLGWSIDKLNELFGKSAGYLSEVTETASDFQFYAVLKRYDAKMLSISDVVQPETTVTVYDYLKRNITSQKQSQYFTEAAQEISKSLDIPSNVDRKKTGDALKKLLNWQ